MKLRYKLLAVSAAALMTLPIVACDSVNPNLENAANYLYNMYKNNTGAYIKTFDRVSAVTIDADTFNVDWEVTVLNNGPTNVISVGETNATTKMTPIIINWTEELVTQKIDFELKAKVSYGSHSIEKVFKDMYVPVWYDTSLKKALTDGIALGEGKSSTEKYFLNGTITALVGSSYYIQDEEGYGFYVYNKAIDWLAIGKRVEVVSTIQNYSGLIETKTIDSAKVVADGDTIVPKEFATFSEITQMDQSKKITLKNAQFVKSSLAVGSSSSAYFTNGGVKFQIRTDKYLDDEVERAIKTKVDALVAGATVDFVNINVGWYKTSARLAITSADQIVVH